MALNVPNNTLTNTIDSILGTNNNTPTNQINQYLAGLNGNLGFPADRPKFYTQISISTYSRNNILSAGVTGPSRNQITLPLPLNLIDQHHVQYDETPLNLAGAIINQAGGVGIGSAALAGSVAAIGSAFNTLTGGSGGGGNPAGEATGDVVASAGGGAFSNLLTGAQILGYAPNEFVTILLKGPTYKRHTLKWLLSPNSFKESAAIRNILNVINNSMAPGLYANGLLFTFPDIFEIAYVPNPGYLYKFKPAVVTDMFVDYSGGGSPAFYRDSMGREPDSIGGSNAPPESITIELHLIELEYWLNGQFQMTNDATDGYFASSGSGGYKAVGG